MFIDFGEQHLMKKSSVTFMMGVLENWKLSNNFEVALAVSN